MAGNLKPLELIIRAVNRVSGPVREINDKLDSMLKPVRRVSSSFGMLGKQMGLPGVGKALKSVGTEVAALGRAALFGAFGAVALAHAFERFIEMGDAIPRVAKAAGVTTDALQEMRYAADEVDVSRETLDAGLIAFSKNAVDAGRNVGRARAAFAALKLDPRQFRNNAELLEEFRRRVNAIGDEDVRNRIIELAFGSREMANFIGLSADEMARLTAEARRRGAILSKEELDRIGEADDALKDLKQAATGLWITIAKDLVPQIKAVAEATTLWLEDPRNREALTKEIIPALKNLAIALGVVGKAFVGLMQTQEGAIALVVGLSAAIFGPLLLSLGQLGVALARVAFVITGLMVNGLAALSGIIARLLVASFPPLLAAVKALWALMLANPIVLTVAAIAALAVGVYVLYRRWKPFHDLVDSTFQTLFDAGARVGKFLGLVDDPESRMGSEDDMRERAVARIRENQARGFVGQRFGAAREAYSGPQTWQGNLAVAVSAAPGSAAAVTKVEQRGAGMTLDTGRNVDPTF